MAARLLKRMALWQQDKHAAATVDITEQVLGDVEQLLNIQRGNVMIDSEMGMPDLRTLFHSQTSPDTEDLGKQFKFQIQTFETRLDRIEIEHIEPDGKSPDLKWLLRAEHAGRSGDWFEADIVVNTSGRVAVRVKN